MSWGLQDKLRVACESFLRVPPLLLIDEIFRISFGFGGKLFTSISYDRVSSVNGSMFLPRNSRNGLNTTSLGHVFDSLEAWLNGRSILNNNTEYVRSKSESIHFGIEDFAKLTEDFASDLIFFGEILLYFHLFVAALVIFMLSTENLIKLYSYLTSLLTLYISYTMTQYCFGWSLSEVFFLSMNLTVRVILASVFYACKSWSAGNNVDGTISSSKIDRFILAMFFINGMVHSPSIAFLISLLALNHSVIVSLPTIYKNLLKSWNETKRIQNEYGLSHLIQVESARLKINTVFRLFWMARAAYDACYRCCDEPLSMVIKHVMIHGSETFTGIVGMTTVVSAVCHQVGDCLIWLLFTGNNNEVDINRFGSISTVLFFILSLQSGLTSMDPEKRLDRLMKNLALLGTALLHALHQLLAPLLHAFRSFQAVQIRAASLSFLFLFASMGVTVSLLRWSTISTWSLAVLALAIEFKIKIVVSLIISFVVYLSQLVQYPRVVDQFVLVCRKILPRYIMHFFDHLYDEISHEDMVFYLKTFANIAEFITGVFLFFNAVWIFLFESTSAIRAIGMSIHAYFNIWCEAQKGFRIYSQRKTASKKIMSLKDATEELLQSKHDDVCSICYEGFESAKLTNCGHLFHAVCLRKWLYVQNTCPMCHEILYKETTADPPVPHPQRRRHPAGDPETRGRPAGNLQEENLSDTDDSSNNLPQTPTNTGAGPATQNVTNGNDTLRRNGVRYRGHYSGIEFYEGEVDGNETDVEDNGNSSDEYFYEDDTFEELDENENDDDGADEGRPMPLQMAALV